jgi:ABC-type antimicrobial peptide transport system permease subunit
MVIAVLGMFNTLTITLLERTKEIGLLISLGARKKDIRRLFIVEAVVLSLSGALFGLVMAWLMGAGINTVAIGLASSRGVKDTFNIFFLPYWLILAVLLFATVVGLIVVAFPARRAVRISPVTALRRGD